MPKKRTTARPPLSKLQTDLLLHGTLQRPSLDDPTVEPGDLGRAFEWWGNAAAMRAAWVAHRADLLREWVAEHPDDGSLPWASERFDHEAIDADADDDPAA